MKIFFISCILTVLLVGTVGRASFAQDDVSAEASVELSVELKLGTGVKDRVIIGEGEIFNFADVARIYCWSKITGVVAPIRIKYIWYKEDDVLSAVSIEIRHYEHRTWSYKSIGPEQVGNWKVEIVDNEGNLLGVKTFLIK